MGDAGGDERSRPPMHVVRLRIRDDGADVSLARSSDEEDRPAETEEVWSHAFSSIESAWVVAHMMVLRSDRWSTWARMAVLLGPEFLTGVIENEIVEAARLDPSEDRQVGSDDARNVGGGKVAVFFSLLLGGRPRLVGIRKGRRFLTMELDTAVAALRIWDWVRWQSHSFASWYALVEARGPIALEIMILDATRTAESRARAEGYAAEGVRPLRYWRPDLAG